MRGGEEETPQNGRQLKSKSLHLRRLPPPFTGLYRVSIRCSGVVSRCSAFFLLFFQFRYVTETGRVRADHCDWLGLLFVLTTILCWMVRWCFAILLNSLGFRHIGSFALLIISQNANHIQTRGKCSNNEESDRWLESFRKHRSGSRILLGSCCIKGKFETLNRVTSLHRPPIVNWEGFTIKKLTSF